jgi:protein-S-isoprenylcysteine O-methyltransferase Ste14
MPEQDYDAPPPQPFTWPVIGTLYSAVVASIVIAILDTDFGRDLQERLDAPARALVAAPVLFFCAVVFCSSLVALVVPRYRRQSTRIAEYGAWLIPAWLLMSGVVLGGLAYALDRLET